MNIFESPQGSLWDFLWGTVHSTVSRIYLKRLVLLLMQLSQRKLCRLTGLSGAPKAREKKNKPSPEEL
jgi:hypothetical protein